MRKLLAALLAAPLLAYAQAYPTKPVRIVLPFGPGGVADITTRTIAPRMSEGLGQQVVVENLPGAGGIRASETVARADPDGHTLLLLTNGNAVSQALFKSLPYDPLNDFVYIGPVFRNPLIIVANDTVPFKNVKELVDYAKRNPNKLNWGYPGAGTTQHLTGELFKQVAGVDIQGVMYKGSAQAVQDLLGGQIPLSVDGIGPNLPHIKSGKLRAIASTGEQRASQLPDVPTVAE